MSIIDNLITGGADAVDCGWGRTPEEMQTCFVHRDEPKTCPRYAKDCDVCEYDEPREVDKEWEKKLP